MDAGGRDGEAVPLPVDGDRLRELLDVLIDNTSDPATALTTLVTKLAALFDSDVAILDLLGQLPELRGGQVRIGLPAYPADELADPEGVRAAIETGTPVLLDTGRALPPRLAAAGVRSGVCVPTPDTRSVLSLYRASARPFSRGEVELIAHMRRFLSTVLGRVQRVGQLSQLAEHSLRIGACRSEREIFEHAMDGILPLLHADVASVTLVEGETGTVTAQRGRPLPATKFAIDPVVSAAALRDRRVFRSTDLRAGLPERADWAIRAALLAPVEVEDEVVALLGAFRYTTDAFTPEDEDVLTLLAGQVSSAIANTRLVAKVERRRRGAEVLREVSATMHASLDVAVVAERFCAAAVKHSAAKGSVLLLLDEDGRRLVPACATASGRAGVLGSWPAAAAEPGDALEGLHRAMRNPDVTVHRLDQAEAWVMVQPIVVHDRPLGVLLLEWHTAERPRRPWLLQALAETAGRALEQAQLFERAERSGRQLTALHDVAQAVNTDDNITLTLSRIVESTRELTGAQVARIGLVDDPGGTYTNMAIAGEGPVAAGAQGPMDHSVGAWTVRNCTTVWVPDTAGGISEPPEAAAWMQDHSPGSAVAVPMRSRAGAAIGFLTLRHPEPHFLTRSCIPILERFATEAALAVENDRELKARRCLEDRLREQATRDPLTGLPNRTHLLTVINRALAAAGRSHPSSTLAVVFLDLDRFKTVNDGLGHAAGDELLVAVGDRLREAVRPGDVVGRLGGDEFVVLLERLSRRNAAAEAELVAERILTMLAQPIVVRQRPLFVSASIGLTVAGSGDRDADDLIRDADIAMYRAKMAGKAQVVVYEPSMSVHGLFDLEGDLRRALDEGTLQVFYQPIVELETGEVRGVEALTRWHHPRLGAVPPEEFIALAEQGGLMRRLDQWVLETALRDLQVWSEGCPGLELHVNISAAHLHEQALPGRIARTLQRMQVPPDLLSVEITETAAMWDASRTLDSLLALRSLGIGAVLDDFGTGYSNFGQLRKFPLRGLKIDRSFVEHLDDSPQDAAIIAALTTLSSSLGLNVIAEGVETAHQHRRLLELGCRYGQGFLFAPALPLAEFTDLLAAQSAGAARRLQIARLG